MRHRKAGKKLGRNPSHRRALFNNLLVSLIEHERLETTDAKAKELKRLADRLITLGKKATLAARRHAARDIRQPEVLRKLFDDLAPRYADRPGGYSRILKLRRRQGDGAPMSIIALIPADEKVTPRRAAPTTETSEVTTKERFDQASTGEQQG